MISGNKLFKQITENIKEGLLLLDYEANILYANTYTGSILGYTVENIFDKNLFEILIQNKEYQEKYIREHKNLFDHFDEELPSFELETFNQNGETIQLELKPSPIEINEKHFIIYVLRNTSEKKHHEREFKEYQEIFHKITNTARDGIIVMDSEAQITYWNPAAEKIFGYSTSEAISQKLHQLICPEENQYSFTKKLAKFKYTGKGFTTDRTVEAPAIHKSGENIVIELSFSTLLIKDEWSLIAIVRDITERKKSDEILTETILKFESIFNAVDAKVYISDKDYNVTYLDNSFNRYEIITEKSQKCYKFLFDLDSPCPWCKMDKVLEGNSIGYEILNPENNNWYYIFSAPTEFNGKKVLVSLIHNIQDIKKATE